MNDTARKNIDLIHEALNGQLEEDQFRIAEFGVAIISLLIRKNIDYGSSVYKSPRLAPKVDAGTAMLVRMNDKVERLVKLLGSENAAMVSESTDDTMADLAGYLILYLARPKDFPLEKLTEKTNVQS